MSLATDPIITWKEVDTYFKTRLTGPGTVQDAEEAKAKVLSFIERSDKITHEGVRRRVLDVIAEKAGNLITSDELDKKPRVFLDVSTLCEHPPSIFICVTSLPSAYADQASAEQHQESLHYEVFRMMSETYKSPNDTHSFWDWPTDIAKHIEAERTAENGSWRGLDEVKVEEVADHLAWMTSVVRKRRREP